MIQDGFATTLVPIDKIKPPLFQCRMQSLDENLDELVESIKTVGLLEPLIIRFDKDDQHELVIGSRRLKASKKAGLTIVPVVIRELTDEQALEIEGSENLNRNDLLPEEKTRLCVEWAKRGYDANGISGKLHKSYSWVVTFLPSEFKDAKRAEAGKLGGEAKSATIIVAKNETVTTQDMKNGDTVTFQGKIENVPVERIQCLKCLNFFPTDKVKPIDGKAYCFACAPFVHAKPVEKIQNGVRLEKTSYVPKGVPEWILSWQDKKNRMEPEHSKREENLTEGLAKIPNVGPIRTGAGARFTIVHIETETDTYLPAYEAVIYADGPHHDDAEQKERDEWIRATLKEKYPELKIYVLHHRENLQEWLENFDRNVINKKEQKQ